MPTAFQASSVTPSLYLVPVAGPKIPTLQLAMKENAQQQSLTLGRHDSCELLLPANAESVSRFHARFRFDSDSMRWRVSDLGSTWGTYLNGVKLTPHTELPIGGGDMLRIEPWTFAPGASPQRRGLMTSDDSGQSIIRTFAPSAAAPQILREDMLTLLLEAAASIHDATNETDLAKRLIDTAIRGSGLQNAAVLRPVDSTGQYEIVANHLVGGDRTSGQFTFSRSLLEAASHGQTAEISGVGDQSHSIIQLNISAALCVPLMLGPAPAAYLYLDARAGLSSGSPAARPRPNATAFCAALGRLAGLALSNLKRMDVERRQAAVEHDLTSAAAAQRWVMPRRETKVGILSIIGESRPGRYVGGDFFDVIDLGGGRVGVALGDVSGKGVEASVLMTATQGFLHAALLNHRDPGPAVTALNSFVAPRRPASRFVTLWVGVIDTAANTISYIDAGHGFAVLVARGGEPIELNSGGGPPMGVSDDYEYLAEVIPLPPTGRLMVVSDGIVEQPTATLAADAARIEFGMAGVKQCLAKNSSDDVADLFHCLIAHAGSNQLADDATGVCVTWAIAQ